ncbi:hypothetical protein GCM10025734_66840 [Kitasatospora paranensis]
MAALRQVTDIAPPGSRIVSVTGDLPGGEMHYDDRTQVILSQLSAGTQRQLLADPLPVLRRELTTPAVPGPSYLVLTRAQAEASRLTGLLPDDTVRRLADLAAGSPEFRAVYVGPDAVVYEYAAPTPATTGPVAPAGATPAPDQIQPSGRQP